MKRYYSQLLDPRNWIAAMLAVTLVAPVAAVTPQEKGYEIAARADRSDRGFGDSVVDMQMVLQPLYRARAVGDKSSLCELSLLLRYPVSGPATEICLQAP